MFLKIARSAKIVHDLAYMRSWLETAHLNRDQTSLSGQKVTKSFRVIPGNAFMEAKRCKYEFRENSSTFRSSPSTKTNWRKRSSARMSALGGSGKTFRHLPASTSVQGSPWHDRRTVVFFLRLPEMPKPRTLSWDLSSRVDNISWTRSPSWCASSIKRPT
ncbi:MAG: hypothetical protein Ct9H300mP8_09710 [Gammaproteobacteria bacterium]|nr:MAG: hypothetical protein Ct9H300mP8_09710 [Gammaproteobacteria bacterium]